MLLERLIERQRKDELTDEEFAAVLGVSRQMWQKTRTEEQRIGEAILRGVTRAYPELQPLVLLFLQSDVPELASTVRKSAGSDR
jgi:hypothetical protein